MGEGWGMGGVGMGVGGMREGMRGRGRRVGDVGEVLELLGGMRAVLLMLGVLRVL